MSEQADGGVYQNPTGVDCQDCPFRGRWYPPEGSEHPHKHDLATDHEVEYIDADEIRESVDYEGRVVAVHDEQTTLVTDGGRGVDQETKPGQEVINGHVYDYPYSVEDWHGNTIRDGLDNTPPFLNTEEIDILASELEDRFEDGIGGYRDQVLVGVLKKLPDSEHGRGELPDWIVRSDDE